MLLVVACLLNVKHSVIEMFKLTASASRSHSVRSALANIIRVRRLFSCIASHSAPAGIIPDLALPRSIPESKQSPANTSHASRFSLNNKTIVVTGAGRGLGITLAEAVLEAGEHVACLDILDEPAEEAWSPLRELARKSYLGLSYHKVDITNEEHLERVFKEVDKQASEINAPFHGAIACAGVQQKLDAVDYPAADFERVLRVNVTGAFLTAEFSAQIMVKNKTRGSIVLIASMSGQIANRVGSCSKYETIISIF